MFNIKTSLKLIGVRAIFILLSIFFLIAFTWLLELAYGFVIYSALLSILYFGWVYGDLHKLAERERRNKLPIYPLKGLVIGLTSEILSLLIFLALVFVPREHFRAVHIAYIVWQAPFVGFLVPSGAVWTVTTWSFMYPAVLLFMPFAACVGYFLGYKKISLSEKYVEKLIYRKQNKS